MSANRLAGFSRELDALLARVRLVRAVNINSDEMREDARNLVQQWFRSVRPLLLGSGVPEERVADLDVRMQDLLRLANGRNRKVSYVTVVQSARQVSSDLEFQQELSISRARSVRGTEPASSFEESIVETLESLVPTAALSYRQVLEDLASEDRISYRGTANELRSVLWDVLDRLAPDSEVESSEGFKLEKGRDRPTQRQKARFVLKSRRVPEKARKAPETAVALVEDLVGGLTRAAYDRSSIAAHVASTRDEVMQVKRYVDSVLAELLSVKAM